MSRLIRNFLLVCIPILLAGCQHPLAPSFSTSNDPFVNPVAAAHMEKTIQPTPPTVTGQVAMLDVNAPVSIKPKDAHPVASVQKRPESQVGQLADGLMLVFTTFTGH